MTSREGGTLLALGWILRLRWFAVVGQLAACAVADGILHVRLPWGVLLPCIGLTALTNGWLAWQHAPAERHGPWVIPALLGMDIVVLTVMLYFTGGAHNPFTTLYILHIVLAVILLPSWGAWVAVTLCTAGFGVLFFSGHDLVTVDGRSLCHDFGFHLQGMVVGLAATGGGVVYFVGRLNSDLRNQQRELFKAREVAEEHRRFEGLATLAAGVAHELATPLSTIAVVSADLEQAAARNCGSQPCQSDAHLIRTEVERCRQILGRMGGEATKGLQPDKESMKVGDLPEALRQALPPDVGRRLVFSNAKGDLEICAAPDRLVQCLAILAKNAAEASSDAQMVQVDLAKTPEGVAIAIRDQGCGMDRRVVDRLGEPFFTTKPPGRGMGLGLFLVRTFCREAGIQLAFDSHPGEGTQVRMLIPARG